MEVIKKDDPVTLAKCAENNNLQNKAVWKWAQRHINRPQRFQRMLRQAVLQKKNSNTIKCQFGVRVPRSIKEALKLDELNGNNCWKDAIETKLRALWEEHNCFKRVDSMSDIPDGCNCIPLLWAFAVKFDGRHRAQCVAGGHITPDLDDDLHSGVVDFETVRLTFVAAVFGSIARHRCRCELRPHPGIDHWEGLHNCRTRMGHSWNGRSHSHCLQGTPRIEIFGSNVAPKICCQPSRNGLQTMQPSWLWSLDARPEEITGNACGSHCWWFAHL